MFTKGEVCLLGLFFNIIKIIEIIHFMKIKFYSTEINEWNCMQLELNWVQIHELNWIEWKINGMQIGFKKNQNLLVTVVLEKKALKTHIFKKTLSISFYLRMG